MALLGILQPVRLPHSFSAHGSPPKTHHRAKTHAVIMSGQGIPELDAKPQFQRLVSLKDLPDYKGVLLDQFGVLHDGREPYAGAIEGVQYLADQGFKLLIISNSSRRKLKNLNIKTALVSYSFERSQLDLSHSFQFKIFVLPQ